ncbi:MAG: hypothetical protein E7574_04550 [Ruminococcaceae bacterium]|nr:hypothetical protein [Oscillospiraceae bacterium]
MKKYLCICGILIFLVVALLVLWIGSDADKSNHVLAATPENVETESVDTESVDTEKNETEIPENEIDIGATEGEENTGYVEKDAYAEGLPGYVAPEGWYQPVYESSTMDGGDYNLSLGVMGLKVYYVQKALKLSFSTMGYYYEPTRWAVYVHQARRGMIPTGVVDIKTWVSLGLSREDWKTLGTYIAPVRIEECSTRDRIIEVFLDTAKEYLGTPYVVGASGKPGQGVDCSGLVLECLYSIGINPDGLDPVQHSTLSEYNSRLMWADPKFKEVSREELLPGDLVFYRRPWGSSVCHVAIYLGDDKCIEALHGVVSIEGLDKENSWDRFTIKGFKRVIAY